MAERKPEYGRGLRQHRENKKRDADTQASEAAQNARITRVETSLNAIVTRIESYADENSPQNKKKVSREWWEIRSLIAAAAVGAAAIIVGNLDARDNRRAMQAQTEEMQNGRRAWVAMVDASTEAPIAAGGPMKIVLPYINPGHEPGADMVLHAHGKAFSRADWDNGNASKVILEFKEACFKEATYPGAGIAFPTLGNASQQGHFDSQGPAIPDGDKYSITPQLVSGDEIFAMIGCATYNTVASAHHTSFCFFYDAKMSNAGHLTYCNVGNNAG